MSFLQFRSNALQSLSLLKGKQKVSMSKDEIEDWIKVEYNRLYNKTKGEK